MTVGSPIPRESSVFYLPIDRRLALAEGRELPDWASGAALFADISGFTALTEALAHEMGPQQGADVLSRHLNAVYDALIAEAHRFGFSAISFAGDGVTCWRYGDNGLTGVACALAMQQAMAPLASMTLTSGQSMVLTLKVAVAAGTARRFIAGDNHIQVFDVLAGSLLDRLAVAERCAHPGEVVLDPATAAALADHIDLDRPTHADETHPCAVVRALRTDVAAIPWDDAAAAALDASQVRAWVLPAVHERLRTGLGEFLGDLRPVTALFLQFSGIDYDSDPAAGHHLDRFLCAVQSTVERYGGHVMQLMMGDKGSAICAAFGAPEAYEDDAQRAVTAAVELKTLAYPTVTVVRIGIAQGLVRAGAYGGVTRRTYGILGDGVNLAARLMQAAAAGQILASDTVTHATSGLFHWDSLLSIQVKGKQAAVDAAVLVGPWAQRTRRSNRWGGSPLVGRQAEVVQIGEKLERASQGQGQVIGITAEAGMGKSRLLAEAVRLAEARGFTGYSGQAESYGTQISYLAWHEIWRRFFGYDPEQSAAEQTQRLAEALARIEPQLAARVPLLGAVLNISLADNELTRSFDAKLRKASLESLLVDCVRARAQQAPLMLVLDECQWLDALSIDLLEAIARAVVRLPVVILLAYRPPDIERRQVSQLARLPHFTEILLDALDAAQVGALIAYHMTQLHQGAMEVPEALVARIAARAQGNPFYIEELIKDVQERGIDPHDTAALMAMELPVSLHRLMLSRIDRLAEGPKTTLRFASVIGRQFDRATLGGACVQCGGGPAVQSGLDSLSAVDLIMLETPAEQGYVFKHTITQEAAYETLLSATRAQLHEQVAVYLERTYPDTTDQLTNLLAYHYGRSENLAKKRHYLLQAGRVAQANYDNASALAYYRRALPLVHGIERVEVLLAQGQVLELLGDWEQAGATYRDALALAQATEESPAQARCQIALGELDRKRGAYDEASTWLAHARQVCTDVGDEAGVGRALHSAGSVAAQRGDYAAAVQLYEASLAIRRRLNDQPQVAALLSNLGIVARLRGDLDEARTLHEESLGIRRVLGDRRAIAVSLNNLGNVALDQHDTTTARERLEEAVAIQRVVGDKQYLANALNNLGNVIRAQGDWTAAHDLYIESLTLNQELGDTWALAYVLADLGVLAACEGRSDRALHLVGAASALRDQIGATLSPAERAQLVAWLAPARDALGDAAANRAEDEGRAIPLDVAIEYARFDRWLSN